MCGIAGIYYFNFEKGTRTEGLSIVHSMLESMHHRGPDQRGVKDFGNCILGMNRLKIIDRRDHELPYEDEGNTTALVYNGEIYNHLNIRSQLRSEVKFKTQSDTETLLYDLAENGLANLIDYNGMYAFAMFDKSRNELTLVRDKGGEKPLYYIRTEYFLAFASEMKSLTQIIGAAEHLTNSYRAFEFAVGRETLFKDILQLLPGEYLVADSLGNVDIVNYWNPWEHQYDFEDYSDLNKVENHLAELLEDSILLRTKNSSHPIAVFTAGGIDSALMACISKPDQLYYCHYDLGKAFDELEYAQLVAAKIKKKLNLITPQKEDFERVSKDLAWYLDTPCTWTAFSLWMLVHGLDPEIKITMTGEGADEAFAGYHRYHLLHHDEQINQLQAMQEYTYLIKKYYGSPCDRYLKLVNRCEDQLDLDVQKYLRETIQYYFDRAKGDIVRGMGLHDFYTTMQVLLQMSDRVNMAHSVENRSPFMDHRLIAFAFQMPSSYKIRDGVTKWILKKVAKKFIPHEIADRVDKRGFSAPVNLWFGWSKPGQYNRSIYRETVLRDWREVYRVNEVCSQNPGVRFNR